MTPLSVQFKNGIHTEEPVFALFWANKYSLELKSTQMILWGEKVCLFPDIGCKNKHFNKEINKIFRIH